MRRSRVSAVVVGGLVVSVALGTGMAIGSATADDTVYTGCLKNGKIDRVAIGTEPADPCGTSEQAISWNASGRDGTDGATWFSGVSTPDASLGQDGDLFLLLDDVNTAAAGDVFVKQDGTWVTRATLRGPEGPQGERGPEGPKGDQGEPGEDGADGGIHVVHRLEQVEVSGDTEVLYLDVPTGRYADVQGEITWSSDADPSSDTFDGSIGCTSNVDGIHFGGRFSGAFGVIELSTLPQETIAVGHAGITVSCRHGISEIGDDGTSRSLDVVVDGSSNTWLRVTPVADLQDLR